MIRREMTAQYSGIYRDFRVLRCLTVTDIFQKDSAVEFHTRFCMKKKYNRIESTFKQTENTGSGDFLAIKCIPWYNGTR